MRHEAEKVSAKMHFVGENTKGQVMCKCDKYENVKMADQIAVSNPLIFYRTAFPFANLR
jgi:hypothetical protein